MTRISDTKVVQLIESTPPRVVIADTTDTTEATEITFTAAEVDALIPALQYLRRHMPLPDESVTIQHNGVHPTGWFTGANAGITGAPGVLGSNGRPVPTDQGSL